MKEQQVGHYKILEKLGAGGMGEVWLAEDTRLGRKAALKFLPVGINPSDEEQARFLREAQAASALDHSNICTIYEAGETEEGTSFIAMAYCEGETLRDKIARGPLPLEEALDIARQIGEGLARAHREGIIHRDIKPSNVLITADGVAKIVDFGLAAISGATKLTKTGTSMGTVAYAAPEQLRGDKVDHRADIWSLGIVLYEMITGRLPFEAEHEQGMVAQILQSDPEPVTALRARVPMELDRIISKILNKAPTERFQHVDDALVDLIAVSIPERGTLDVTTGFRSAVRKQTSRYRLIVPILTGVAAVLIGLALYLILSPPAAARRPGIAVLSFESLDSAVGSELAVILANEVNHQLQHFDELKVLEFLPPTRYETTGKTSQTITSELGADQLLSATVQSIPGAGNPLQVRIISSLVGADGVSRALDPCTGEVEGAGLVDLAIMIAENAAIALSIPRTDTDREVLSIGTTENLEAVYFFNRGRDLYLRKGGSGVGLSNLESAVQLLYAAVAADSTYALAWSYLARTITWGARNLLIPNSRSEALQAAERALALEPLLPEAHIGMGYYFYLGTSEFEKALQEFNTALELYPDHPEALYYIGAILRRQGQWEEAYHNLKRAMEIAPRNQVIPTAAVPCILYMRKYAEAEALSRRWIELDPSINGPYTDLALIYLLRGETGQGIAVFENAPRLIQENFFRGGAPRSSSRILRRNLGAYIWQNSMSLPRSTFRDNWYLAKMESAFGAGLMEQTRAYADSILDYFGDRQGPIQNAQINAYLGLAHAFLGNKDQAIEYGLEAERCAPLERDTAMNVDYQIDLAEIYVTVGEFERALEKLEKLLSIPAPISVPLVQIDPIWAPLRSDPRFEVLMKKYK
ncbi:protein kinase [Gemmatimonadota bacterium]